MSRTWVSPTGTLHDVTDEELHHFCKLKRIHYSNMVTHVADPSSDQKNGGWRLIERLRAIGHVDRPHVHVLALGTLEAFWKDCLSSDDGRHVLKNRDNLGRLLKDRYNGGGKAWLKWQCRHLSTAEKRALLQQLDSPSTASKAPGSTAFVTGQQQPASQAVSIRLPDYGALLHAESSSSAMAGSLEVSLRAFLASSARPTRCHFKPGRDPTS